MNQFGTDRYLHDDERFPMAWAPWFSHEYINYFSIHAFPLLMDQPPVAVMPPPPFAGDAWPVGPKHRTVYKEVYQDVRRLDPFMSFDYEQRNGEFTESPPVHVRIEPWKILVLYSTEPDLFLDCDLNLDWRQRVTGGSHGWRHMQFRVCGLRFGIVLRSFHYYRQVARKGMEEGTPYWGWRYLARCLHYLADMGNPFHVKAAPTGWLFRKMFSPRKLFRVLSAIHQSYEIYVQHRFRQALPAFREALLAGALASRSVRNDFASELSMYLKKSQSRLIPIFDFFTGQFGREIGDVVGPFDSQGTTDISKQINWGSAGISQMLFESRPVSFERLNSVTEEILFEVGKMLGLLLKVFSQNL